MHDVHNVSPKGLIDIETVIEGLGPAYARAVAHAPNAVVEADYRMAGHAVRVRTVGPRLAEDIDKALQHLRSDDGAAPELTVELWDDAEIGPIQWGEWPEDPGAYSDFRGNVSSSDDTRFVMHQRPSSIMLLDRKRNHLVGCVRDRNVLFQDERARPFHLPIMIWLDDRKIHFIHSALVSMDGVGLLIAGRSGAGKTSSSISCFLGGFTFLSDDYVALEAVENDGFVGHSLYATCLIDVVSRFPALEPFAHLPNGGRETKSVVYLSDHEAGRFARSTRLAAVVLPKVVDRPDTVYYRAKPVEAMMELAPSSLWLLPNSHSLQKMAQLVEKTPAYRIELGHSVEETVPVLSRLVAELKSETN